MVEPRDEARQHGLARAASADKEQMACSSTIQRTCNPQIHEAGEAHKQNPQSNDMYHPRPALTLARSTCVEREAIVAL